jgi:hypothetical protein
MRPNQALRQTSHAKGGPPTSASRPRAHFDTQFLVVGPRLLKCPITNSSASHVCLADTASR